MKNIIICIVLSFAMLVTAACAETIGKTNKEVRAIAEPILDNIFDGIEADSYATWSKDFDPTMKDVLTKEKFAESNQQVKERMGNCTSRKYLAFLNKGEVTMILWKAVFDKTKDDVLITLVLSSRDGKYQVAGLWFQ